MKQSIHSRISLSLIIIDLKMVMRKFLDPSNLLRAQTLYIYELTKIVVICEKINLILKTLQVVAPSFEGFNNIQEFLIMSFITSLYLNHFLRKKDYWMPLTKFRKI